MLWFIEAKIPISISSEISLKGFSPRAVAKSRTITGGLRWMIFRSPDAVTVTEGVEMVGVAGGTGAGEGDPGRGDASGRGTGGGGGGWCGGVEATGGTGVAGGATGCGGRLGGGGIGGEDGIIRTGGG